MTSPEKIGRVHIGNVWDRTTQVLNGRGGPIASVALLTLFVPSIAQNAVATFIAEGPQRSLIGALVSLVAALVTIWGGLAILALASHPSIDRPAAQRQATARLLPVIGVSIVLGLILVALVLPPIIALAASGFDFRAAAVASSNNTPALMPAFPPSIALFIVVYMIALTVLGIWAGARLMLMNAVVLNERRGLGAIRRSIALTRGLTWKLIGVLLLFVIVLGIATLAAQSVIGIVFRLILGADQRALAVFLGGIAAAAVSAALLSVAYVFTAQLYVATLEKPSPE